MPGGFIAGGSTGLVIAERWMHPAMLPTVLSSGEVFGEYAYLL
jgi:hypothetical protein